MGAFTKDKKRILPAVDWKKTEDGGNVVDLSSSMEIRRTYEQVKEDLAPALERINDIYKQFKNDWRIFQNYIHDDFLRDVDRYFWDTSYFSEWALKDAPLPDCLIGRMKHAKKIIEYVENDKSVDITSPGIDKFVKNWKQEFRNFKNL